MKNSAVKLELQHELTEADFDAALDDDIHDDLPLAGYQGTTRLVQLDGDAGGNVCGPQQAYPHSSFSPDEKLAAYTSDASGHPQVCFVEL